MPNDLWPIELLASACVVPIIIGAFSRSLAKAVLGAALVMALAVFVAYAVPRYLGNLAPQGESFGRTMIRALAVTPSTMFFAAIGYGVRLGLLRIFLMLAPKKRAAGRRLDC